MRGPVDFVVELAIVLRQQVHGAIQQRRCYAMLPSGLVAANDEAQSHVKAAPRRISDQAVNRRDVPRPLFGRLVEAQSLGSGGNSCRRARSRNPTVEGFFG